MITLSRKRRTAAAATAFAAVALVVGTGASAHAEPIDAGTASAFGATITAGGEDVVPPTPEATTTLAEEDVTETLVNIPAEPLAVSGTLNADAAVHEEADILSQLAVNEQELAEPYHAAGVGLIEGLDLLLDSVEPGVSLVTADVVRAEAVGACVNGMAVYSANSEIINLQIGGEPVPLNEPLEKIIDGLNAGLVDSGLAEVVNIERNVVTPLADGIAVDALVVTVLSAAGEEPLAQARLASAEVTGLNCAPAEVAAPAAPAAPAPAPQEALPRTGSNASTTAGFAALMAMGALSLGVIRHRMVS